MYSRSALESSRSTPGRSPLPATVGSRTGSREPAACRRARRSRRASSMTAVSVLPDRCASSFASASTSSSRLMVVRMHQIIQACHQYASADVDCESPQVAQTPFHQNCGAVVRHLTTSQDSVLRTRRFAGPGTSAVTWSGARIGSAARAGRHLVGGSPRPDRLATRLSTPASGCPGQRLQLKSYRRRSSAYCSQATSGLPRAGQCHPVVPIDQPTARFGRQRVADRDDR